MQLEAYCDASGREFSYLDLCNSLQRRAVDAWNHLNGKYFSPPKRLQGYLNLKTFQLLVGKSMGNDEQNATGFHGG